MAIQTEARSVSPRLWPTVRMMLVAGSMMLGLSGCFTQTLIRGQAISEDLLREVQIGTSREQVELVLGTPSTTATLDSLGYYYISQREETTAFFAPSITDQRIVAVYFDDEQRVKDIANYGLQDGKVFDFIRRKTRTGGRDIGLLTQILSNSAGGRPSQLF